jgi:hypothetical protein
MVVSPELHDAGLSIFDLVAQARLPDIHSIAESDHLPKLRQLFEKLYDGTNSLQHHGYDSSRGVQGQ